MNPEQVKRGRVKVLTDLPNVGKATARDLELLGIRTPADLAGRDPVDLYRRLSRKTGVRQDPCVLDVFMSLTSFADGGPAKPWWEFTAERKRRHAAVTEDPLARARRKGAP
jgi:hypothetical protein